MGFRKSLLIGALLTLLTLPATAQYEGQQAGAPPEEIPQAIRALLQSTGYKILKDGQPYLELWFRKDVPQGPGSTEMDVSLKELPPGAFVGVARFLQEGQDRRGQPIKPGLYTMRYHLRPVDGAHQGVSPTRDFFILGPISEDQSPEQLLSYQSVVKLGQKASGTPHPAVFEVWKDESGAEPGSLEQMGESDWVLHLKVGELPIAMIVAGVAQIG